MKIATLSDLHIRNLKYFNEYKKTFVNLFDELKKENPDLIVFTGDLFHTKSNITGEAISLAKEFFRGISKIAPTHCILGNHDVLVKSKGRLSAVLPISEEFDNVKVYIKSGFYPVDGTDFVFAVHSVLEDNKFVDYRTKSGNLLRRKNNLDKSKINIALYHGMVKGSSNKFGYTFLHGDDASVFNDFDFAFLGDIHKRQKIDNEGRIQYAGSLIQQNHGESGKKGFLVWDIKSKNDWTTKFVEVKSPLMFRTIELESNGDIPEDIQVEEGAHLRVISRNNLPSDIMKRALDEARKTFRPYNIVYDDKGTIEQRKESKLLALGKENLRDPITQEKLIREYLKRYKLDEDVVKRVLGLNKRYSAFVEGRDDTARNVHWELLNVEWDNLFNFGKGNFIDFTKLSGIVGIFGKNFSGKTSAVEVIAFTIFNSIAKRSKKNYNIINQNKNWGRGKVELLIGREKFTIERKISKYTKRLKGQTTQEAKTELDVNSVNIDTGKETCFNGASRPETDKNLRKIFGTLDDFLLISMADQMEALSFVREGSTRRKEILVNFLDLDIFVDKYDLAKEDSLKLKNALKDLESVDYDKETEIQEDKVREIESSIKEQKEKCEKEKTTLESLQKELFGINSFINSAQTRIIDKDLIKKKIAATEKFITDEELVVMSENKKLLDAKEQLKETEKTLLNLDIDKHKEEYEQLTQRKKELKELTRKEKTQQETLERIKRKINTLEEVPCGITFKDCKFIKDAFSAKSIEQAEHDFHKVLKEKINRIIGEIRELERKDPLDSINKHSGLVKLKDKLFLDINTFNFRILKRKTKLENLRKEKESQQEELKEYYRNEKIIKELKKKENEKNEKSEKVTTISDIIQDCDNKVVEFYKQLGSTSHYLSELREKQAELLLKRKEFAAYDYFLSCMHVNGIVNEIIKNKLPSINEEIQKILANVVSFQISLELADNKLDILIKFPKFESRIMDMGSGAEHHLAAIAIRLALLNVTSLPVSNIFILDEPASALDADNLEGFVRIMEMIKSYFGCVILISHLDVLKDSVDDVIEIEKNKNGFARIKQ